MGSIKPTFIKRTAIELVNRYPNIFAEDFSKNKTLVKEISEIYSKAFINRVAGYITHYNKVQRKKLENQ